MSYTFLDAAAVTRTADSSIISGTTQRPIIEVGSILSAVPVNFAGSPSISGAVTIVGTPSISGGVTLSGTPSISGAVTIVGIPQSSVHGQVTVASTIAIGNTPNVNINGIPQASVHGIVSVGSTIAIGNTPNVVLATAPSVYGNISGSVLSQQMGTAITSVINSNPSSLLTGTYGHRNDAVASYLGADLSWRPIATDSAGRTLSKPFAAEESRIEGYVTTTNTSVTTVVDAAGAGLRNYITDIWFANTGSVATLITLSSQGGASILGYTIAPSGSGSNLPGLVTPIRTGVNETFNIQAGTAVSILYATVKGFKAP